MIRWIAFFFFVTCAAMLSVAQGAPDKKEGDGNKPADIKPSDRKVEPPRRPGSKNASGILDITFDDLKFDIEKGGKFERTMLTPKIEDLKGKKLTIRGYILPASVFQREGIKAFTLVRDDKECCFGPMAAIYDCIRIELVGDAITSFTTRPITVEGEFDVKEALFIEGRPMAIYQIKAKSAK